MRKGSFLLAILLALTAVCFAGCAGDPQVIDPTQTGTGGAGSVITVTPSQGTTGGGGSSGGSGYVPDIKDFDDNIEIGGDYDFSATVDYTGALGAMTLRNGTASENAGVYSMESNGSLYACTDATYKFPHGSISADVINNGADAGIIFGLSASGERFFDGGSGASYYFYFVSMSGYAYLGRTTPGSVWVALQSVKIDGWAKTTKYNIKAVFRGNRVVCYLDGQFLFAFTEQTPLTGTGWGLRCNNGTGATISNVVLTSSVAL